jgi:hypothetical protein
MPAEQTVSGHATRLIRHDVGEMRDIVVLALPQLHTVVLSFCTYMALGYTRQLPKLDLWDSTVGMQ